jgi:hypothetical protein
MDQVTAPAAERKGKSPKTKFHVPPATAWGGVANAAEKDTTGLIERARCATEGANACGVTERVLTVDRDFLHTRFQTENTARAIS